jgi:hypothetical protein
VKITYLLTSYKLFRQGKDLLNGKLFPNELNLEKNSKITIQTASINRGLTSTINKRYQRNKNKNAVHLQNDRFRTEIVRKNVLCQSFQVNLIP